MFERWSAKECRRLALYAIVGYLGFWVLVCVAAGFGIAWLASHLQWVG